MSESLSEKPQGSAGCHAEGCEVEDGRCAVKSRAERRGTWAECGCSPVFVIEGQRSIKLWNQCPGSNSRSALC